MNQFVAYILRDMQSRRVRHFLVHVWMCDHSFSSFIMVFLYCVYLGLNPIDGWDLKKKKHYALLWTCHGFYSGN